ncbi:MAG TPA: DUF6602 domain-containing protein [Pirellulales bacterium]|nr:DUF6602 domain-containing protein [Pirellulales bacterium]
MNEPRLKHVGADAILAERSKLLALYDTAKVQCADDPVKVEHGHVAEQAFRNYLAHFLPKKYGVAKGHIITRDLTYDGPLEEWDLIVYDVLESPVLYVRADSGATPLLGIPVQHVKAVLEVKATLTQANAEKVTTKLLKLEQFRRPQDKGKDEPGEYLPWDFFSKAVFFETATKNKDDYIKSLNRLQPLGLHTFTQFEGAIILRSQHDHNASGAISSLMIGNSAPDILFADDRFEVSEPATYRMGDDLGEMFSFTFSAGFSVNTFSSEMMDLVSRLNDGPMRDIAGGSTDLIGYGHDPKGIDRTSLWPYKPA